LRSRAAMGYVLAYTAHNFELFAFRSWIVAYLVFAEGLSGVTLVVGATVLAALFNLLGLPSSVIGNELAARFGRHRVITIIMLMSGAVACVLGFAATLPQWALLALCVVYGILIIGESASVTTGVVQAAPEGYRGATMAVHSCIGFSGSFAGPLVFGVVLDLAGGQSVTAWGLAFASAGIGAFLGPLALFLLRERKSV
jgi:MFS family permease